MVELKHNPTLTLVYLPHLDYGLQRLGPSDRAVDQEANQIDRLLDGLIRFYTGREALVLVISEYGITGVRTPIHVNRVLRESGLIAVREELRRELLDAGAGAAFAVADHQVAHVYVNDPACLSRVRTLLEQTPGVERVLDEAGKADIHAKFRLSRPSWREPGQTTLSQA